MRLALAMILVATASAAPKSTPPTAVLDNPCDGEPCKRHALDGFTAALAAQRAGTAAHPLRISYFGDSLTADDQLTSVLRDRFQALLGDGGPGFVFAAPPHPYCAHRAIARVLTNNWQIHGISTVVPSDRLLGLGGDAESDDGVIRLIPTSKLVRSIDVHYLGQPHGGTLELRADGHPIGQLATAADHKQAGFERVAVPEGTKQLELRAHGRVRLFGASLEGERGAVVDNLGIVNATAKALRDHDLAEHWQHQLEHRAPDLVVLMLGTNEAEWLAPKGAGMEEHEQVFDDLLATVRKANPLASCLVVSPLDQLDWRDDKMPPRASVPAMVAAQHRAALRHGCAFWDVFQWMGGKGSSRQWYRRGLVVKDFQHPTSEGAEQLATALFAGLVP